MLPERGLDGFLILCRMQRDMQLLEEHLERARDLRDAWDIRP